MANCKKGNCGGSNSICSPVVQSINNGCLDVCVNPICAEPTVLGLMAPLIYDEIGINLCTTFEIGTDISTRYPTAVSANISVLNMTYTCGDDNVEIEAISGRPNCYSITLSNITVTFALNIYDASCRLLTTLYPTAVYLPSCTAAPTYDEDTNPTSVTLEIFAPYGLAVDDACSPTRIINYVGFTSDNNFVRQGVNIFGIPKLIDFDITDDTATVGLTIVLQSLYFAGYNVESAGRINTPKGSLIPEDNSDCMEFVAGNLLDLAIKPLDLNPPACEGQYKESCTSPVNCGGCQQGTAQQGNLVQQTNGNDRQGNNRPGSNCSQQSNGQQGANGFQNIFR